MNQFTVIRPAQDVTSYFLVRNPDNTITDYGPPAGTTIAVLTSNPQSARVWIIPQGTQLIRGVNLNCGAIPNPIRNDAEPTWFSWKGKTAKLYSTQAGCINGFQTKRQLNLLHLWNPTTLAVISQIIMAPAYTQEERAAFFVYTGFGGDKSIPPSGVSPQLALARQYGWVNANTNASQVTGTLPHVSNNILVKNSYGNNTRILDYLGITWGEINNPGAAARVSTYQADMIVIKMLQKMFPILDGVLSPPLPSTVHGGVFHEELVLFPPISDKVAPIGSVLPSQIAGFFRRRMKKSRKQRAKRTRHRNQSSKSRTRRG